MPVQKGRFHLGSEELKLQLAAGGAEGALPKFTMTAYTGKPVKIGWGHPVVIDLAGMKIPSQTIPVRFLHDAEKGVGHTESIEVRENILYATGVISRVTEWSRDVVEAAKNGFPWQASVGIDATKYEELEKGQVAEVNGRRFAGPMYIIRESVLGEISFVDLGADRNTKAAVAAKENDMAEEIPDKVEAASTAPPTPASAGSEFEAVIAASKAEHARREKITATCRQVLNDRPELAEPLETLARTAMANYWDVGRFQLEALRLQQARPPMDHARRSMPGVVADLSDDVIQAAICLNCRLPAPEKHFTERSLDLASRRFRRGIGLMELLRICAARNGYNDFGQNDLRGLMRAAFMYSGDVKLAGHPSSLDITGILSATANKFLVQGFDSWEATWRQISAIKPVRDFKTVTSYALTGPGDYVKVPPGGSIEHGTLGEMSYTNKADTYGLMLSIDRRDIINDDLGALSTVPMKLGVSAARKLNNVFWTEWLGNANNTFFSSGHNNYYSGTASALSETSLAYVENMFTKQTSPDGDPIGIPAAILLVPQELKFTAQQLCDPMATSTFGGYQPFRGRFEIAASTYLSNTAYTNSSTTAWYLLANPAIMAAIEVAFLNGQERPTIETAEADFSVLGIRMRGYHDFGVHLQEYRAGVMSKGAA